MPEDTFLLPASHLLAALPTTGGYFGTFKVILYFLAFLLWAHNSAWVDEDTNKVRTRRGPWLLAVFGTGILCLLVWLFVPIYWIGLGVYAVLYGAAIISYCVYRNGRVAPAETVLTMAHFKRLTSAKIATAESTHAQDRVRIKDKNGKTPAWPTDQAEHAAYAAMQDLLFDAIWRRSSDVKMDLLPERQVKIVYKIDGVERSREPIDPATGALIFAHLKRIGGMSPEERRRPQQGNFKAIIGAGGKGDRSVDVDVKTSGSTAGERLVMKLFSAESKFRVADLGFTKAQLGVFEPLAKSNQGLIIIAGPKSSGVTSSLYALLRSHDAFMQNIHTLEISKALDLENVTQHVFDAKDTAVPFHKKFQSILRTDPDVMMGGDTPDPESAVLATQYSKGGKKIYMGLTANDTFSALRKWADMVGDAGLVAGGVTAITCQRLVRVLCTSCRRAYKPDPALLKKANLPTGENRPFYRPPNPNEVEVDKQGNPVICAVCQGSGYYGRTGLFELLVIDGDLRKQLAAGTSLSALKSEARKRGMLYLQEVGLQKVYDGLTSINEVLRVTKEDGPSAAPAAPAAVA